MKTARDNSSTRRRGARPRLFISYRRRFDHGSARLLKQELTRAFGEDAVFRDVDDIEPGEAFPETIDEAIKSSDALLLLVSPGWVELIKELHKPDDFVRREVAAALTRQISLIPVLLGGARMPKPDELPEEIRDLAFRQAIELSDARWDYDVARLVKLIRAHAAPPAPASFFGRVVAAPRTFFGTRFGKAVAVVTVVAAVLLAAGALMPRAFRYVFTRDFEGCVSWYAPDVLGGAAKVEAGAYDVPVVTTDQYRLLSERRDEPGGVPLLVRLSDAGKEVGAVFLRVHKADVHDESTFTVERVLAPPCADVQDYGNDSLPAADKHFLKSWNRLRVSLGGRSYLLRTGDHGDTIMATLTPRD